MPITNRNEAKESGFAQVREALQKFEGTVASAEFGQWGGALIDENGKPLPKKEFLEVTNTDVEVLEVTEELAMPIDEWSFRVNCSDYKGSFWVEKFLESADRAKVLIPDDIIGKRVVWEKASMEFNIKGRAVTQTNFVIAQGKGASKAKPKVVSKASEASAPTVEEEEAVTPSASDPMEDALKIAIGKTEAQFKTAFSLKYPNSPLVSLAKAGALTQALVNDGKLALVDNKYQLPE